MSLQKLVLTIAAQDRPGVVQTLSDVALQHKANWLESSLSHLCGQFVGIVQLEANAEQVDALKQSFTQLSEQGISVVCHDACEQDTESRHTVELYVEANDRAGIIEEISAALATSQANVEQLESWCESASMAGYDLFIAQLAVSLPTNVTVEDLENALENVSDDLMVSISSEN